MGLDIRRDVLRTQVLVSQVQRDVVEMQQALQSRNNSHGENQSVSDAMVLWYYQTNNDNLLDSKQVSEFRLPRALPSYIRM